MATGEIVLGPWELLALAALPLSAISGALKRMIRRRIGGLSSEDKDET